MYILETTGGDFKDEVVPIEVPSTRKGEPPTIVYEDDDYKRVGTPSISFLHTHTLSLSHIPFLALSSFGARSTFPS
jgi:hypothetical protein